MTTPSSAKRNVIIGLDGSEHAEYAFEWYIEHVKAEGDHLVIVYVPELHEVLHSSQWSATVYQYEREVLEGMVKEEHDRIRHKLDGFADKLKEHSLGGKVESVVASKPGEGILNAAEKENAHLIILGSRGKNTLRRTFMGSISDYVVHHSHVPVLVCKHPNKHPPNLHEAHNHPHPHPH